MLCSPPLKWGYRGHILLVVVVVVVYNGVREMLKYALQVPFCIQCYPRFKNLRCGCKSLELCADVASDVGIKAKSRLLRFL